MSICPIVLIWPVLGAASEQLGCNESIVSHTLRLLLRITRRSIRIEHLVKAKEESKAINVIIS